MTEQRSENCVVFLITEKNVSIPTGTKQDFSESLGIDVFCGRRARLPIALSNKTYALLVIRLSGNAVQKANQNRCVEVRKKPTNSNSVQFFSNIMLPSVFYCRSLSTWLTVENLCLRLVLLVRNSGVFLHNGLGKIHGLESQETVTYHRHTGLHSVCIDFRFVVSDFGRREEKWQKCASMLYIIADKKYGQNICFEVWSKYMLWKKQPKVILRWNCRYFQWRLRI